MHPCQRNDGSVASSAPRRTRWSLGRNRAGIVRRVYHSSENAICCLFIFSTLPCPLEAGDLPHLQYSYFKVASLVLRSLSGNSASYLADDCCLVADARERRLRSTESRTCVVTRTHITFGDGAFAAAGPGLWNSLPPHLIDADFPCSRFRRSLKTFLFG